MTGIIGLTDRGGVPRGERRSTESLYDLPPRVACHAAHNGLVPYDLVNMVSTAVGALGTAGSLWYLAVGQRDDRRRKREERLDAERRDARRVTVRVQFAKGTHLRLAIHNGGDGPILDVEPSLRADGIAEPVASISNWVELMNVPAGQTVVADMQMARPVPDSGAAAAVEFTDSEFGFRWIRTHNLPPERLLIA